VWIELGGNPPEGVFEKANEKLAEVSEELKLR
jgi:hypothetical protein